MDSTRKNYYVKYSQRATLAIHLFANVICFPTIIEHADEIVGNGNDDFAAAEERYNSRARAATVRGACPLTHLAATRWCPHPTVPCTLPCTTPWQFIAGFNSFKTFMGIFMLAESIGATLLEPLLVALPKRLKCLRVGPLASPGQYSARDWAITNILCVNCAFLYLNLAWKNLTICGWSRDAFPWNLPGYPYGGATSCDTTGQTFFENVNPFDENTPATPAMLIGYVAMILGHPVFTCGLIWLMRKLPGWGEPPLFDEAESTTQPTKPPPDEKEICQAV